MKDDKLKLKPTLREKRHYLIIKLIAREKLSKEEIKNKITKAIKNFIGLLGLACAGPVFVKIKEEVKKEKKEIRNNFNYFVVLSVTTKYVDYVKTSLLLFNKSENDIEMKCIGVSGTLKKSERFLRK